MSDIRTWISEFRNLSGVGLIDSKAAYDANPGKTPAEVWVACGGKVPKSVTTLETENSDLRDEVAQLRKFTEALAGLNCNCQWCGPDVDFNRHYPSCMVGQAQEYLGRRVEWKEAGR